MGEGFRRSPFSQFDPGSAGGGVGGGGGGRFRGKAVSPGSDIGGPGNLPQVYVVRKLGLDPTGRGWVAHVENLPPGMQDVPLPFSSQAPLQMVIDQLTRLGHIVQIGD